MSRIIFTIILSIISASIFAICSGCGGGNEEMSEQEKQAQFCANFIGPVAPGSICDVLRNSQNQTGG